MTTVEIIKDGVAESAHKSTVGTTRGGGSRRRRISSDEKREIAALYANGNTTAAEIRERFGIGESSLYRVLQRYGVTLRGRSGPSSRPQASEAKPAATTRSRRSAGAPTDRTGALSRTADGAQLRFEVRYQAVSVFKATDVRDVLRQAESLGATEITAIAPEP